MNATFFARSEADDEHLLRCWALQDCNGCLKQPDCSWCPFSWTCVPNSHQIQFLAPAWEGDNTCPHWAERWEIRTQPLGCNVSTITTLTSLTTIACTLLFVLLVWLAVVAAKKTTAYNTKYPGWWRTWRFDRFGRQPVGLRVSTVEGYGPGGEESEPLLPSTRTPVLP